MSKLGFYSHKANDETSDNGPRTASVLTFSINTNDSFVKELTQNSLDARQDRGGNLKIKVSCLSVLKSDVPRFSQFEIILDQMESYWNMKSDQYKRFFETAKSSIVGDRLNMLVFEDSLTTGLVGNDNEGTFKNCVNDENVSGKEHSDSLGNHGIGKNSVFGYSGVHMVFYSSLNIKGEYKFKGVSKLGNYKDALNVKRSERIYYGAVNDESVQLLSDPDEIPNCFKRFDTGLSQFVIGAEVKEDWAISVKKAFISNYWFLFETEKLEVDIDGVVLNKENYAQEAVTLFVDDNKSRENPLPFIKAYQEVQIHKTEKIFKIGNVHFFAREAEGAEYFPNKIAFLRDGMKIKLDNLGMSGLPVNIAGVMFCDNEIGNSILGAMEPHAHDKFIPELVAKKQVANISIEEARKILTELEKFKKDVLLGLREKYTKEGESIDIIDDLFSALLGSGKGSGVGKTIKSEEETFNLRTYEVNYDGVFASNSRNSLVNNTSEVDLGEGIGPGTGTGSGGKGLKGGDGIKKGEIGGSSQSKSKVKGEIQKNLSSRFFISESGVESNIYKMILRSDEDFDSFNVVFSQYGDSGRKESEMSSILKSVKQDGLDIPFDLIKNNRDQIIGYRIKGLSVVKDEPTVYELEMKEKTTSALQIIEVI